MTLIYKFALTITDDSAPLKGDTKVSGGGKLSVENLKPGTGLESVLTETLTRELQAGVEQLAVNARPVIEAAEERERDMGQKGLFGERDKAWPTTIAT